MSILIDFSNISQQLSDFESNKYNDRINKSPLIKGLSIALICLEWEGTISILSESFIPKKNDMDSFIDTLNRLGYDFNKNKIKNIKNIKENTFIGFIEIDDLKAIYLGINSQSIILFDYLNNDIIEYPHIDKPCVLKCISEYSCIFREPPPETQDKRNWLKYSFYSYNDELKSLIILSFLISLLSTLQPFFIMGIYNFALTSGSINTLLWITTFSIIVALIEFYFRKMRINIVTSSGKKLALYISKNVIAKLLWLPFNLTSTAGVSSQLARLRDIDTFRQLLTTESTLSYFDMPFITVFIIAIAIMSGSAALVVFGGLILMFLFCVYSRYMYTQATSQSSRANAMVSYQWNDILRNITNIQGLPLLRVIRSRFNASLIQSTTDSNHVTQVNNKIQAAGGGIIQFIGTTSIIFAVIGVMDGSSDTGAMLAVVILVWKALGPIMGIYNSISKFNSIKSSALQINNLMSMSDDRETLQKSPPIRSFEGFINVNSITHRYTGNTIGLTNLNFKISSQDKIAICGISGSGKTTLLTIFAGLEDKYQGSITIDGYNIKQFNNYRYRSAINYIPFKLHIFDGTLKTNFILHNGLMNESAMADICTYLDLDSSLPLGLNTKLNEDIYEKLPNGTQQKIRLALGLGNFDSFIIIIDEPFNGVESEYYKIFNKLISDKLHQHTVIFSSSDPKIISCSNKCCFLNIDGTQKYVGITDKYLENL